MPTIFTALEDSGAIDVTIEEDEDDNKTSMEIQDKSCHKSKYTGIKRHQEAQTELFSILSIDRVVKKPTVAK